MVSDCPFADEVDDRGTWKDDAHSIVLAFLSFEVCQSPSINNPVGISTLPLKAAWLNSCVNVGAMVIATMPL